MSDNANNSRVCELETQIAHIQRLYDQLNEVVTDQSKDIDRMRRQISALQSQIKEIKEKPLPAADPLDEKPPHY